MDETKPLPPWADQIPEGAFISNAPTYKVGEYFNLFKSGNACGMKYYFYDPTEHGFPAGKEYPLLTFLHGRSNALEGDICINYTGAEFYATEKYQSKLGGAYILIPVANEKRNKKGYIKGTWDKPYTFRRNSTKSGSNRSPPSNENRGIWRSLRTSRMSS